MKLEALAHPLKCELHQTTALRKGKAVPDGALTVRRIYDPMAPQRKALPIVICPPPGCNERIALIDLKGKVEQWENDQALATFFAASGWEVFIFRPRYAADDYDFAAYVEEDLSTAIAYARMVTGSEKVNLLGPLLAGIAVYAYLALDPLAAVSRFATIGAPIEFSGYAHAGKLDKVSSIINFLDGGHSFAANALLWSFIAVMKETGRIAPPLLLKRLLGFVIDPYTIEKALIRTVAGEAVVNPGISFVRSFINLVRAPRFPYIDGMRAAQPEGLLVLSEEDQFATPDGVRAALAAFPKGKAREYVVPNNAHFNLMFNVETWKAIERFFRG